VEEFSNVQKMSVRWPRSNLVLTNIQQLFPQWRYLDQRPEHTGMDDHDQRRHHGVQYGSKRTRHYRDARNRQTLHVGSAGGVSRVAMEASFTLHRRPGTCLKIKTKATQPQHRLCYIVTNQTGAATPRAHRSVIHPAWPTGPAAAHAASIVYRDLKHANMLP
jgi:hypothetical protein